MLVHLDTAATGHAVQLIYLWNHTQQPYSDMAQRSRRKLWYVARDINFNTDNSTDDWLVIYVELEKTFKFWLQYNCTINHINLRQTDTLYTKHTRFYSHF